MVVKYSQKVYMNAILAKSYKDDIEIIVFQFTCKWLPMSSISSM